MDILLNEGGVTVAPATVNIHGQVYALRNIASVRVEKSPPQKTGCLKFVAGFFALTALANVFIQPWVALFPAVIVVGVVFAIRAASKPLPSKLVLVTSAGEVRALVAEHSFAIRVADAIVRAMQR